MQFVKSKVMFLDTEATGFKDKVPHWRALSVAFAIIECDISFIELINREGDIQKKIIFKNNAHEVNYIKSLYKKMFHSIIKVDCEIPKETIEIHGITNEISNTKGRLCEEVLLSLLSSLEYAQAICCHNTRFDIGLIMYEAKRYKLDKQFRTQFNRLYQIDTSPTGIKLFKWFKQVDPNYDEYEFTAHDAACDTLMLYLAVIQSNDDIQRKFDVKLPILTTESHLMYTPYDKKFYNENL